MPVESTAATETTTTTTESTAAQVEQQEMSLEEHITSQQEESEEQDLSFDELLAAFDKTGDELLSGKENHTGIKTEDVMAALETVPEAKKLFGNLRRLATQKAQEAAEAKRQYEAKLRDMEQRQSAFASEEFAKRLDEILKPAEGAATQAQTIDPFNPESMQAAIQAEARKVAAELFQQQLGSFQQAKAVQEAEHAYSAFKAAHPEIETPEYQQPIAALLQKHATLTLQEAWDIVDVAKQREARTQAEAELTKLRTGARTAGLRTGGGVKVPGLEVPKDVLDGGIAELYAYLERTQAGQQ